ncbi:MAG: imidazole glycerol phosphate synthase subunit HisH [Dehalococcoidia bacterium]
MDTAIVDYGTGNIRSVLKAVEFSGYSAEVIDTPEKISAAKSLIIPGQGSSGYAMKKLREKHLVNPIIDYIKQQRPFFGVCLGLQLLMETSEEDPEPCLGIISGEVKRFKHELKIPHMGWNQVQFTRQNPVFSEIPEDSFFYFVHSYYVDPLDENIVLGKTDYGLNFCSAIAKDNIIATQFHPEKSGEIGLSLYKNFLANI